MTSTTIVIPGREDLSIANMALSVQNVKDSFQGDIDLSGMTATETKVGDDITITFANRTGTKGADIHVHVAGDINITDTRIVIPGREDFDIPDVVMTPGEIRSAMAGDIDLSQMTVKESVVGSTQVIEFSNKTGTKGNDLLAHIMAAASAMQQEAGETPDPAADVMGVYDVPEEPVVPVANTRIVIPGREDQIIPNIVMDADMVSNAFSGEVDLSGYAVSESDSGTTHEVRFSARTGTKGE